MSRIFASLVLFCGVAQAAFGQDAPADESAANNSDEAAAQASASEEGASAEPAAEQAPAPSAEAVQANEAFEGLVDQWNQLIGQLRELQPKRDSASGAARQELDAQMKDLRAQTTTLIDNIGDAALAVYKLDPLAFPTVNRTLIEIVQFHVTGDARGDGGDQYEKALKLANGFIDAGGGEKFPVLYVFAGMSAYATGELNLAERYLKTASDAGQFASVSEPTGTEPPSVKLYQDAVQYLAALPTHRKHWEEEQKIRAAEAQADDLPRVKLTTTKGDIVLELFENEAPKSVANFITLAKKGYYDNVVFHRVLPLFMAQGGDPQGTGGGGPGYNIRDEQGLPNARRHFRGSLSMANTGEPNTGGSQFFLTFVPTSYLDGRHAVFGRVIEGMDVAASLKRRDPNDPGPKPIPDKIIKAEVLRDRGHAYEFEKLPE
jgi:cyclophilin family peptidyl-prolyl cis-trans isomerase